MGVKDSYTTKQTRKRRQHSRKISRWCPTHLQTERGRILLHQFIWWQCKDDAFKLADNVQRIQIRRIERDMLELEELVRRCLGPWSGGDAGGRRGLEWGVGVIVVVAGVGSGGEEV